MDSFGGEGGVGDWALPLAAFAAGFAAPERTRAALQGWSALQEQQLRQRELTENRAFREKQFAAQETEREDVGKTRAQQRETSAVQLAQLRAQQQAGQLLPGLQFSRDVSVGQPEIPAQFGDVMGEQGVMTQPAVPGTEVRGQVPLTIEDMRKQIMELSGAPPDVRAEMFEKLRGFNVPLSAAKEPDEIQRARHGLASERFLAPQVGALPARRMGELIRSGAVQFPPEALQRAIAGNVQKVDTGQYVRFIDLTTGKDVLVVPKTTEPKVQVIDDPSTGMKSILFINPHTKVAENLPTDIPAGQPAGPNTVRLLAARIQNAVVPGMPAWIQKLTPEAALETIKTIAAGEGGDSAAVQILQGLGIIPPTKSGAPRVPQPIPAPSAAPKPGAAPSGRKRTPREEAEEYLRGGVPREE